LAARKAAFLDLRLALPLPKNIGAIIKIDNATVMMEGNDKEPPVAENGVPEFGR